MRVTSTEFIKRYDTLLDQELKEPVTITSDGEDRLVVLSIDEYRRLKRRDRRVFAVEDLSDEEIELIAKTEMSPEHAHLDAELADWKP